MREENLLANQPEGAHTTAQPSAAFAYLKSLPPNYDKRVLESYKKGRDSQIIDHEIAESFTTTFRGTTSSFSIPVSWSMSKAALVNLLGITDYDGYEDVNGVRFYAGINCDNQLTLVAVSTEAGEGCNEDLTYLDDYPYYDYAEPCPVDCSNRGNLKVAGGIGSMLEVTIKTVP